MRLWPNWHRGRKDSAPPKRSAALEITGPNELSFAGVTPWWRVLLRQFFSPLIGILLVAAVVTLIQQEWVDAGAIGLILALNAGLGFAQERKAEADVRALQSLATPTCRVLRDGAEVVVRAATCSPGTSCCWRAANGCRPICA